MAGILAGALANKSDGGKDAGNIFNMSPEQLAAINKNFSGLMNFQGSDAATNPLESSRIATNEVQNNNILGQLFAKGGTMDRTNQEEQRLSQQGYALQPEDHEAYGQMSGDLARQFGQSDQNLAQALSQRGQSTSGAAGRAFAGAQGNKMEQLAGLQRQIADHRMQSTMQRLGQTRQFLGQLGQQGESAINDQFGRQQSAENMGLGEMLKKNDAGMGRMSAQQNQANENLSQRQATAEMPGWAGALSNMSNMGSTIATSWGSLGMNRGQSGDDASGNKQASKKGNQAGGDGGGMSGMA